MGREAKKEGGGGNCMKREAKGKEGEAKRKEGGRGS